jgi:hypothetical protein
LAFSCNQLIPILVCRDFIVTCIFILKIRKMKAELYAVIPVLPSENIERDIAWYKDQVGFETHFSDSMYAVLYRDNIVIHLQWHAATVDDPLLGGSVTRIMVKDIRPAIEEFVTRGTVTKEKLRMNTPWGTHEFGFFDLNQNAIFIMEDTGIQI